MHPSGARPRRPAARRRPRFAPTGGRSRAAGQTTPTGSAPRGSGVWRALRTPGPAAAARRVARTRRPPPARDRRRSRTSASSSRPSSWSSHSLTWRRSGPSPTTRMFRSSGGASSNSSSRTGHGAHRHSPAPRLRDHPRPVAAVRSPLAPDDVRSLAARAEVDDRPAVGAVEPGQSERTRLACRRHADAHRRRRWLARCIRCASW